MESLETDTEHIVAKKLTPRLACKNCCNLTILESLAIEQQQTEILTENASLRLEIEKLRMELVKQKMENFKLTTHVSNDELLQNNNEPEKTKDLQNIHKLLLKEIEKFLNNNLKCSESQDKLNLFENVFKCFNTVDTTLIEQARSIDKLLHQFLCQHFEIVLKVEVSKIKKELRENAHKKRQKLIEQFQMGLKMQNWAQCLELHLWVLKLISEFRHIIMNLATEENQVSLLQALQTLEKRLEREDFNNPFD